MARIVSCVASSGVDFPFSFFLFHYVVHGSRYPPLPLEAGVCWSFSLRRYPVLFSVAFRRFSGGSGSLPTAILVYSSNSPIFMMLTIISTRIT